MVAAKIAIRFLKSSKAQTVLIIVGLAVGIAVQIFVGSLLQNLQEGFLESTTGDASHVTIAPKEGYVSFTDWEAIAGQVDGVSGITAVNPVADGAGLLVRGEFDSDIQVRGMDLERAEGIYEFSEKLYEGSLPATDGQILLGKELGEKLEAGVGDEVTLLTRTQDTFNFTVSGFYDLGSVALNERWTIVRLSASQTIFNITGNVTSIECQTTDIFESDAIGKKVANELAGGDVEVENWKDANPDFFSALAAQGSSSTMIQTFVLMSVVIGIASVLSITVVQKSRQIGILKAMGIKDGQSSLIFMYQGLFLGLGGAVLGVVLGSIMFYGFIQAISSSGDSIIKANFNMTFILASGAVALASSIAASLLPALKSRKLDPIEVIRNG